MIGKLERVPLREVWKNEVDFTRWLQENIDVLNEVLDLTLVSPERERQAGDFAVDLVAEDDSGNTVVIENQLEASNHDHLGKLITYLTAIEANTAVWIVAKPRPEHVEAVAWLNKSRAASFYLVKVEAVRIAGADTAAPLLTLIVAPSEEARWAGERKDELAERHVRRRRFWTELLNRAKGRTQLFAAVSPGTEQWISTGAGKSGLALTYVIRKHDADVHLYIDRGKDSEANNKAIFDRFVASKHEIEKSAGASLEWQRLEGKRACRIKLPLDVGGLMDEEKWPQIQDAMIDAMVRLERSLRPFIELIP